MQGERDSFDSQASSLWLELFNKFAEDFSNDLREKSTPMIIAQIGAMPTDKDRPYWNDIQLQQTKITENPRFRLIQTQDIAPYCPEKGPHFCPEGYNVIAQRAITKHYQFGIVLLSVLFASVIVFLIFRVGALIKKYLSKKLRRMQNVT